MENFGGLVEGLGCGAALRHALLVVKENGSVLLKVLVLHQTVTLSRLHSEELGDVLRWNRLQALQK